VTSPAVLPVAAVSAVSAVHEDVQEWAGEEQQEWQHPEDVRRVLRYEVEAGDGEESQEHQPSAGPQEAAVLRFVLHLHQFSFRGASCRGTGRFADDWIVVLIGRCAHALKGGQ